jgi:hypothetical protein
MQTFLPFIDFRLCAMCLDEKRLRKQHVECYQIINTIEKGGAWKNHPAVVMWTPYKECLKYYANLMKDEILKRGFKSEKIKYYKLADDFEFPKWLGDKRIHVSQQSNLMRKLPEYYKNWRFVDYGIEGYYWPSVKTERSRKINEKWTTLIKEL